MHFINIQSDRGKVSGPEMIEIAKAHNIYTFNDASADVPPKERLWEYPAQGWDFVAFSGGKDICGPQASGILIGKEKLIRWAQMNMSPQEDRIGRSSKVGKETIFALLKALELFVNQDYDESHQELRRARRGDHKGGCEVWCDGPAPRVQSERAGQRNAAV